MEVRQPTVYIFKDEELQLLINNKIQDGLPLFSCRLKEVINGEVSLSFSIPSDHPSSELVREGCWAVVKDKDGLFRAFVIVEETETHDDGTVREFYCEQLGVNELNDEIVTDVRLQNTNARDALQRILANTGSRWAVGTVDDLGIASTNVYYESTMSGIQKVIQTWGGEIRFRVSLNSRNEIVGRYIDLVKRLGHKTGKRFEYSKDLVKVERYIDMKQLKTALYGRGKGEKSESGDGYGRRITFADVVWSKTAGDPVDKPLGQEWVGDPNALELWGHLNSDGSKRHRLDVYINEDQDDPAKLLQETWDHLQAIKKPLVTYKMDVIDLEHASGGELKHEAVRLGDSVYCIDKYLSHDVRVEARVVEIDRDLIDPSQTQITLGNIISDLSGLIKEIKKEVDKKISVGDPVSWLDGYRDAENIEFEKSGAYVYIRDDGNGIITTNRPIHNIDNPPDMATQIKSAGMRIANSRKPDGSFDWKTFMTADGMIADRIVTGRIKTDNVEIGDDSGKILLSGGNLTIKGGGLEVYSTPDASDNGVMIRGNKVSTNFVKNPDFDLVPNSTADWTLAGGGTAPNAVYDATNKIIKINTTATMSFLGISQYIDIYHPRATFQALFKCNLTGGSTVKSVRFYFYNFDKNGVQLADRSKTEALSTFQEWHLLTHSVEFPPGTVKSRMFVQIEMKYNMNNGFEIHWVKGCYDEYVTQQQLTQVPQDQYNALPEIQQCFANITHGALTAGTIYTGEIFFEKTFRAGPGRINVVASPYGSNAGRFHVGVTGVSINGCTLAIRPFTSIGAGTSYVNVLAYRVSYYAETGFSI